MGLACVDVTQIIHWGPASDVERYMQECGRAGRNGQQSSAVLCEEFQSEKKKHLEGHGGILHSAEELYRRALLCSFFDSNVTDVSGCSCCHACAKSYMCIDCNSFPICLTPDP